MNVLKIWIAIGAGILLSDVFDDLIQQANEGKEQQRITAVMRLGAKLAELSPERQRVAVMSIVDRTADDSDNVSSAARTQIAENAKFVNLHLGPYFQDTRGEFLPYAKACESIKVIGPAARIWLPQLQENLDHEERNFRLATLHALRSLDGKDLLPLLDPVIKALDDSDFNVQLSACRVIIKMGADAKKAGPRLVQLMQQGILSSRSWASIALGAIGPHEEYDVVQLLVDRLGMFYVFDRERALQGLAYLGANANAALPQVEKLMNSPEKSVQHIAARTYWKITGQAEPAVKVLITLVPRMEYGVDAMDILAEMGTEAASAVPELVKQLKSDEVHSREAAVYALAAIGAPAAVALKPLKELLSDKDLLVRAAAEKAINTIEQSTPK
jgi:HEAT repeat protein